MRILPKPWTPLGRDRSTLYRYIGRASAEPVDPITGAVAGGIGKVDALAAANKPVGVNRQTICHLDVAVGGVHVIDNSSASLGLNRPTGQQDHGQGHQADQQANE